MAPHSQTRAQQEPAHPIKRARSSQTSSASTTGPVGPLAKPPASLEVRPKALFLVLAAVVYFAALAWAAAAFGTWTDEEYTLATTAHGVGYALSRAMSYELQAPLYFGILAAWREINASVWFARLFSVLCATAFLFVMAKIGTRVAPEFDPVPFALLVALNPFVVLAALEIRLYALALLLSALMWLAFDSGFASGASWRARTAFVLLAICAVYVQYFLAFMLVGFGCALLVLGRPRALGAFVACASVVGLAVVPLAIAARSQFGGYETLAQPPLWPLVLSVGHWFVAFAFPRDFTWNALPFGRPAYLAFVGVTVLTIGLSQPKVSRQLLALLVCAAAIQLTYVALAAALLQQLNERYFVALFVPVVAASYGVFRAVRDGPRPALALAFASCVLLTGLALFTQYRFLAQPGDWKRVAPYLEAHATRDDVIAIFPADGLPAFERQYRGNVPFAPYPRPYSSERYSVRTLSVASPAVARAAFAQFAHYRHIWFVDGEPCLPEDRHYGCEIVESVLASDFRKLDRRRFYRNTVYELSGPGGAATQPQRVR